MGSQKSRLPPHQEEEENNLNLKVIPRAEEGKEVERIPLTQRSGSKLNEHNQKRLSEEKVPKNELFKSRPKLGELKVKRVKEFRATNK